MERFHQSPIKRPPLQNYLGLKLQSKISFILSMILSQILVRPQEKPTPPPPSAIPVQVAPAAEPEPPHLEREDPTTAQGPSWDDELQKPPPDAWIESSTEEPLEAAVEDNLTSNEVHPPREKTPEPEIIPVAAVQLPTQVTGPKPSPRPSSGAHRGSARFKTDQPVVMPSSFGSVEKVGMQFGSLSLGGETLADA